MNPQQLNFIAELFKRIATSKPEFFKKLQSVVLTLAVLALMVIIGINYFEIFDLGPKGEKATNILWYVVTFLGGSLVTGQLATTKPELQDEKTKENVVKSLNSTEIHELKTK